MKEKLTRNIGLKILSIILAAILWLVITNVDDPISTEEFYNVPVEILNEDEIESLDQVYEIVEGDTIDFTVAARRSIADNLTVSDFKVTADFAKLSDVNAVTIKIECPKYGDDVAVTEGLYQVMKVNLEELAEKNFKVTVVTKGEPAEGYYVGKKAANTIIKVSGPKSKIERIKEIVAEVDVSEVSGSFRTTEKPMALDEEGEEIDASNLTFSETMVAVNIGIYETKMINLKITTKDEPAKGYIVTNVEYEPKMIEIAGEDDALDSINELLLSESVAGATENIKKEINLSEQLEEGLYLVGEDQTVVLNITIEKTETKEIVIWPGDIEVKNLDSSYKLKYLTTGPITIQVTGPVDELKDLSRTKLKPYVDFADYIGGTYVMKLQFELLEHTILGNNPTVSVYLANE